MELIFIGSGSAFTVGTDNYHSNVLLIDKKSNNSLLIDCGSDARHALYSLGYLYKNIKNVYISHLHADHVGGIEWLGLSSYFDPKSEKPTLFAHPEVIRRIWISNMSGGMSTLKNVRASLKTFFHPIPAKNNKFIWNNIIFKLMKQTHVYSNKEKMPCFGLFFEINHTKIFFTSDTTFNPKGLDKYYQQADIIFHDCETTPRPSGVHPSFQDLCSLSKEIKGKMWLYHYNPGPLPNAKAQGFLGFIKRGQGFKF